MKLTVPTMKSLDLSWIIDVYNHITSTAGRDVCIKSSMFDVVAKGRENTLVLDLFHDIDTVHHDVTSTSSSSTDLISITGSMYVIKREDTDDDDS